MAPTGPVPTFVIMKTTSPAPPAAAVRLGPIDRASRSLGPDLARGFLLLFIALANVWGYLYDRPIEPSGRPTDATGWDHLADGLTAFFADDRSRPMFAILYGFGLAVMASRMSAKGLADKDVRRVLRRRSVGLIVLGVLHAGLLFGGDILAPYGATGLVALALVNRRAAVLWRWFAASLVVSVGAQALFNALVIEDEGIVEQAPTYLASVGERLFGSAFIMTVSVLVLLFIPHVVVGILLQRAGWLTRPWEHRRTLGRIAAWTAVGNLVGNLPWALQAARVWEPAESLEAPISLAHDLSGFAMGLGYICFFAWLAARWHDRPRGAVVTGVTAVGERSLTCYLLQSVAFAPLLSSWGLGWGAWLGTGQAAALAVGVWAATVLVALALHRAGRRGPFEVLLRRWVYRKGDVRPSTDVAAAPLAADPLVAGPLAAGSLVAGPLVAASGEPSEQAAGAPVARVPA